MPAQQGTVAFLHSPFTELTAKRGINGFVTGYQQQPGCAEIQPVYQCAAGKQLYQPVMHGIQILRILSRQTEQPCRFVNQQQVLILIKNVNLLRHGGAIKVSVMSDIGLSG